MAVAPWKTMADVTTRELIEPDHARRHRSPPRAPAPTQAGLDLAETAIERMEPLTPLALSLHAAALIGMGRVPAWLWLVLIGLLTYCVFDAFLGGRTKIRSLRVRAMVLLGTGGFCFWVSGGTGSPFFLWLLVCVSVYPLVLARATGIVYVLSTVLVYLVGQWVATVPLPALALLTNCGLISFLGFLMYALGLRIKSFEHFQNLANVDGLTQVATRRRFFERAEQAYSRCVTSGNRITVMVFDLDGFKEINDSHGHAIGDAVLRQFGECLRRYARPSDVVGRLGGDEFALFMPNTGVRGATDLLRRVRHRLARQVVKTDAGERVTIKTSAGISTMSTEITNLEALMELADRDLYRQKLDGNRRIGKVSRKMLKPRIV